MIFLTELFSHSSIGAFERKYLWLSNSFSQGLPIWPATLDTTVLCFVPITLPLLSDYLGIAKRLGKLHGGSQVKMRSITPIEIATARAESSGQRENHLSFSFPLLQNKLLSFHEAQYWKNHKTLLNNLVMQKSCCNLPSFVIC